MTSGSPAAGPVTNAVTAAVVIALAAAAFTGSVALGAGTAAHPGPGTWPLIVSVVLATLGLTLAGLARRTTDATRFGRSALPVLAAVAGMVVFVAVLGVIGFEIPALLLTFVWVRFLGGESWLLSTLVSLGTVVAFYVLFVGLLAVPIPHLF